MLPDLSQIPTGEVPGLMTMALLQQRFPTEVGTVVGTPQLEREFDVTPLMDGYISCADYFRRIYGYEYLWVNGNGNGDDFVHRALAQCMLDPLTFPAATPPRQCVLGSRRP